MRCHICDNQLTEKEGAYNKELQAREPCTCCLEIAMDAAYSDGFQNTDDDGTNIYVGEESSEDMVEFVSFKDYAPLGGVRLDE